MRTIYKDPNRHAIKISEQEKNNRHHSRGILVAVANNPEWISYTVDAVRAL